ncbi:hypothetical protein THAOC_05655 [Thalassiosira oceanica]|uniref:Uncharacterized protein n=1 Tax=Thalassiosira oceanica TaxID=159749 RepID=K0T2E5_THAOC|nr:hypothetical protein THAOC_05655 [Thalassiosira oceanica]|eukprot:EJK72778.1 hypothetical protein THAOC_05655 [Thalassiosira oceanica]
MGEDVTPSNLVVMLTLANLGYVMADVAADGEPWRIALASHSARSHARSSRLHGMDGAPRGTAPQRAHPDADLHNARDRTSPHRHRHHLRLFRAGGQLPGVRGRPERHLHDGRVRGGSQRPVRRGRSRQRMVPRDVRRCQFHVRLDDPAVRLDHCRRERSLAPGILLLYEEKREPEKARLVLDAFWRTLKKKAVWMLVLYTMVSSITFNVNIAAKNNANFVWLNFSNVQNQIQAILENLVFLAGLGLIRRFGLDWSWRKMIWSGTLLVTIFNLLYLLIVFDVIRNPWFYMFVDVTDNFMETLNFLAGTFAIVEVSEPGFEAITYALITTANNATIPLSIVISYQFMAFFPDLNTQEGLAQDTPQVRRDFAVLTFIVEAVNLSSLLSLPMLVRQKAEAREMMKANEESSFWAKFAIISATIFLLYSTVVTFLTVAGADSYGCYKILGGPGCTEDESSIPVYCLMGACFLYCYGVNFYHTFLPILRGQRKFSFGMFF